jgi:hypothetical protein
VIAYTGSSGKSEFRLASLLQPLLGTRTPHGRTGSHPVQEGHEPGLPAHIDVVNLRPVQDGVGISISDSEPIARQIGLIIIVSARRTYFSDCAAIEEPAEKVLESLPTETRHVGAVKANI